MARALWKGLINFGLVNVPIELHTGARDHRPRFRLLHKKDLSPINLERVCQKDGHAVAWQDLVKGYEIEKGQFVVVTADDFKTAALERSRSLDILAFVPADEIDARYWEIPYLALPSKGAEHSYALLAKALEAKNKVGIAKYVMRERQHLAALVPVEGRLVVCTMRFPEDLVALPDVATRTSVPARELSLASQLIDGMADSWEPGKYKDDYVPKLMKVIESKAKGRRVTMAAQKAEQPTNVVDLMERLRASLDATKGGRAPAAKKSGKRRAKKAHAA